MTTPAFFAESCALGGLERIPTLIPVTSDHYARPCASAIKFAAQTPRRTARPLRYFSTLVAGVVETLRQL